MFLAALLEPRTVQLWEELNDSVDEILKIRTSPRLGEDVLAWGPGRLGVFSVRSAYMLAFDEAHRGNAASTSTSVSGGRSCWQFIWKCGVPPNVRNFAWRLATNALPTWKNKNKIDIEPTSVCPVCGMEEEDNYHPFLRCQFGRDLYLAMSKVWTLPAMELLIPNGKEWLLLALAPLNDVQRSMMLLIFWRSWYVRNELVHHKPAPSMDVSIRFLQNYLDALIGIKLNGDADPAKGKIVILYDRPVSSRRSELASVAPPWSPPAHGWSKLNTDGSNVSSGSAGAGMILRNNMGEIMFSACRALSSCRDALEAELCACMEGLSLAIQRTETPIVIETDSSIAVSMISCEEVDRSVYASQILNEP